MNVNTIYSKLIISCFFCFALLAIRTYKTESIAYFFLNWNLFLAFAPLLWLVLIKQLFPTKNTLRNGVLFLGWLVLFPNAPYIFTDLMHISKGSSVAVWFDVLLILMYSITGLIAGFVSLKIFILEFEEYFSKRTMNVIVSGILFLSAFGIYLGRFLRFNSWDILNRPTILIGEIMDRFVHPFDHPRTWGVTLGIGVFLNLFYWFMRDNLSTPAIQVNPVKN